MEPNNNDDDDDDDDLVISWVNSAISLLCGNYTSYTYIALHQHTQKK